MCYGLSRGFGVFFLLYFFVSSGWGAITVEHDKNYPNLGSGIRSFTEQRTPLICVTNALKDGDPGTMRTAVVKPADGAEVKVMIQQISTMRELMDQIDLSVASRLKLSTPGGSVGLSAKASFALNISFKENYDYQLITANYRGPHVGLDQEALRLRTEYSQKPEESLNQFIARLLRDCGDSYFASYGTGGYFIALLERHRSVSERSKRVSTEVDAEYEFAGQKVGGGVGSAKSRSEALGQFRGTLRILQYGGKDSSHTPKFVTLDLREIDPNFLKDLINNFATTVKEHPVIVNAHFVDYTTLLRAAINREYTRKALTTLGTDSILTDRSFFEGNGQLASQKNVSEAEEQGPKLPSGQKDSCDETHLGELNLSKYIAGTVNRYSRNQDLLARLSRKISGLNRLGHELSIEKGEAMVATVMARNSIRDPVLSLPLHYQELHDKHQSAKAVIGSVLGECYGAYRRCDLSELLAKSELQFDFLKAAEAIAKARRGKFLKILRTSRGIKYFRRFNKGNCFKDVNNLTLDDLENEKRGYSRTLLGVFAEEELQVLINRYTGTSVAPGEKKDLANRACIWTATPCSANGDLGRMIYRPFFRLAKSEAYQGAQIRCVAEDAFVDDQESKGCAQACFLD